MLTVGIYYSQHMDKFNVSYDSYHRYAKLADKMERIHTHTQTKTRDGKSIDRIKIDLDIRFR